MRLLVRSVTACQSDSDQHASGLVEPHGERQTSQFMSTAKALATHPRFKRANWVGVLVTVRLPCCRIDCPKVCIQRRA